MASEQQQQEQCVPTSQTCSPPNIKRLHALSKQNHAHEDYQPLCTRRLFLNYDDAGRVVDFTDNLDTDDLDTDD